MPSPSARPELRSRLLAGGALVLALLVAGVATVAGGEPDAPSVREQFGGRGGEPAAWTGAAGRVALDGR